MSTLERGETLHMSSFVLCIVEEAQLLAPEASHAAVWNYTPQSPLHQELSFADAVNGHADLGDSSRRFKQIILMQESGLQQLELDLSHAGSSDDGPLSKRPPSPAPRLIFSIGFPIQQISATTM